MPSQGRLDSESESLVNREILHSASYTEEGNGEEGNSDDQLREMDYVDTDVSMLSQFHEDALQQAGFGLFQTLLFVVLGMGIAADSVELFVVAYVMPSAERELCLDDTRKGWLAAVSFLGMMIGGLVWGILGDKIGRRKTLLSALATNAVFSVATAFMPFYGLLVVTRLCSGIGIGGSIPIVFTYYGEFLGKRHRGRHLSNLLIFWAFGGVFAALMAWALISQNGLTSILTVELEVRHLSTWRIFLLVCAIPAVLSVLGLCFVPESPRFLLECGRQVEAMSVYQKIFKMNHHTEAEYQLSELELPVSRFKNSDSIDSPKTCLEVLFGGFETFYTSFAQVLWPPFTRITIILLFVWVTTSFGFYGMSLWFPEYIRKLEQEDYESKSKEVANCSWKNHNFTDLLENTHYKNVEFYHIYFSDLVLSHCVFERCSFKDCKFDNIRTSKSFFIKSTFNGVIFQDTDFYDFRFRDCDSQNSSFIHTTKGCEIDFDINFNLSDVFMQNLIAQIAIIPGNFVSSYILDQLGRVKTIGISLFLTSISAFCIWFLDNKTSVVAFNAIFNFISISGWNAIDVITTETYPATLRGTGYGFLSAVSRLAAIMGNFTFARYISVSKALPVLTTAIVLFVGGLFAFKLNETKDSLM